MDAYSNICPSCGSNKTHKVAQGTYKCDYCGKSFVVDDTAQQHGNNPRDNVSVLLQDPGLRPIKVIKELVGLTKFDLRTCKSLVDKAPCVIFSNIPIDTAQEIADKLTAVGATVTFVNKNRKVDIAPYSTPPSRGCLSVALIFIASAFILTALL